MSEWFDALKKQNLEVRSARDGLQLKGWLDTGNYGLNWAISGRLLGGYPLGHTVEIYGDPGTGKSFLGTRALAAVQERGGVGILDDTEGAYNLEHTERLGVNVNALAYEQSRTVTQHLAVAQGFLGAFQHLQDKKKKKAPPVGVMVCDSLANLSTEHELEKQLDKRDMTKAAELKAYFRLVSGALFDLPVVFLFMNHTIASIGNIYEPKTTPGGGGPKFMASVRVELRRTSKIRDKETGEHHGVICRAHITKNRITSPWKETTLTIPFNQPISRVSGLVPLLIQLGVLTHRGQFVLYGKHRVGRAYMTKDRMLRQDAVGEALLDQFPEILEEVDAQRIDRESTTGDRPTIIEDD